MENDAIDSSVYHFYQLKKIEEKRKHRTQLPLGLVHVFAAGDVYVLATCMRCVYY